MTNLDKLIWHQDEPFPTLSIYAQYSVFEIAANNNLKVMLDGQGADEIFAGYESFYEGYFKELISDNPLNIFQAFIGYVRKHKKFPLNKIAEKIFLKSNFNFGFRNKFSLAAKPFIRQNKFTVRGMSEDYLENFGLHSLLKYEDRNSMTFSVESRVPFLDYRVVEYALNLKTNLENLY
jgi:asparagine synthase (glutamine-hydrolysing)